MKKIILLLLFLISGVQAQTFQVNNLNASGTVTASSLVGPLTGNASSATTATSATNLAAGGAGQLVCQTSTGTTGYIALGTAGYFLQAGASGCPTWVAGSAYTPGSVTITGGSINGTTVGLTTPAAIKATTINATGSVILASTSPLLVLNDSSGTGLAQLLFDNSGNSEWDLENISSTNQWVLQRFISGTFQDYPITVSNSTGVVSLVDGVIINPSTPTSTEVQIGSGSASSQGWYMGNLATDNSGIWTTGVTPSSTNFVMAATSSNTYINSSLGDAFYVGGASVFSCSNLCQFQVNAGFASTNGIIGTTSGNNTAAGNVGEFPTPTNLTGVSLTTGTGANISSFSLTAGDWDVWGVCEINPAATTIPTNLICGVSTTSAAVGAAGSFLRIQNTMQTGASQDASAPIQRINISATTTVYLVVSSSFTVSTETASGYLFSRRRR